MGRWGLTLPVRLRTGEMHVLKYRSCSNSFFARRDALSYAKSNSSQDEIPDGYRNEGLKE